MKKLVILVVFLMLSVSAYADFGSGYTKMKETVFSVAEPALKNNCPVTASTPFAEVNRADLDIEFRLNVLDSPSGGYYNFYTENFDVQITYNLTSGFFVYGWYGNRNTEKPSYEGSAYDPGWESRMVMGGAGIYLTPVLKIYGGAGKIWLENDNGDEPGLDTAIERGISLDVPWEGGKKIVVSYRFIDARLGDEDPDIVDSQGNGSFSSVSLSFSIPFMR